jgi:hypothetical protein
MAGWLCAVLLWPGTPIAATKAVCLLAQQRLAGYPRLAAW